MRIQSASLAFTLLLGFLAAVPYSGIDINLPALSATGATLSVNPSGVGLTMSAFMLSLAVTPLMYGPASDRFGRKPVVAFGIALFVVGSLPCAPAPSLPALLACRFVQGSAPPARQRYSRSSVICSAKRRTDQDSQVMVTINVATMVAPTAGAALLTLGNWRLIYAIQAGIGLFFCSLCFLDFPRAGGSIQRLARR